MPQYASIQDLADARNQAIDSIIDVRPLAAYNGWTLRQEMRGGHIPGAMSFPLSWFGSMENADLIKLLGEKGNT